MGEARIAEVFQNRKNLYMSREGEGDTEDAIVSSLSSIRDLSSLAGQNSSTSCPRSTAPHNRLAGKGSLWYRRMV